MFTLKSPSRFSLRPLYFKYMWARKNRIIELCWRLILEVLNFILLLTAKENPTKRPITGSKKSSLLNPNLECLKKPWESGSWTLRVTSQSHNSTLLRHPLPPPNSLWHRDNLDFTPFNSRTHLKPDIFHLYIQAHRSVQALFLWTFSFSVCP